MLVREWFGSRDLQRKSHDPAQRCDKKARPRLDRNELETAFGAQRGKRDRTRAWDLHVCSTRSSLWTSDEPFRTMHQVPKRPNLAWKWSFCASGVLGCTGVGFRVFAFALFVQAPPRPSSSRILTTAEFAVRFRQTRDENCRVSTFNKATRRERPSDRKWYRPTRSVTFGHTGTEVTFG